MRYNVYRGGVLLNDVPLLGPPFTNLGLASNSDFNYYGTAVDDEGVESLPSTVILGHTDNTPPEGGGDPEGTQNLYEYYLPDAPTNPTEFTAFALRNTMGPTGTFTTVSLPFYVAFGIASPTAPASGGYYYSGGIWHLDQSSSDHAAEVTMAIGAGNQLSGDRSVMPIVRADASGDNWVSAVSHWNNTPASCQILTCINRVITIRASAAAPGLSDNDRFRLGCDGTRYTTTKISGANGVETQMCVWDDTTGAYPTTDFRRTGLGFQHLRSGGVPYGPPGISQYWRGGDLRLTVNPDYLNAWVLALFGLQSFPTRTGSATNARAIVLSPKRRNKETS